MRNAIKAAYSIGSAALILSGAAAAQTAIPDLGVNFGQVTGTGSCPAGATCSVIASGTGFLQMQIDDTGTGASYIQTLITDTGFSSEDFVQMAGAGGSVNGIASQLSVTDGTPSTNTAAASGTIGTGFGTTATITSGWAATGGSQSNAVISLTVSQAESAAGAADDFMSLFNVDTSFNGTTNVVNSLSAEQVGYLGNSADKQHFYTQIKPASAANTGYTIPTGVGSTSWAAGDQIQIVWVGQDMPSAGLGSFGSESVSNLGTGTGTSLSSTTQTGPFDWNAEFGTAPTF